MSSTGLKQSVDLSGNIHKLNSRHVPGNFAEQQKSQQNGQELRKPFVDSLLEYEILLLSADTH